MDPVTGAMLIGSVAAPIIGGMYGSSQAQSDRDAAMRARQQALQLFSDVRAPSVAEQQLALQQYQSAGQLSPQMEQALQLGPSAMQQVKVDPRLAQAQMSALNQLSQIGQFGMTPAEAAALKEAQRQAMATATAQSKQIQSDFARRGMGGAGAELAARLEAAQAGADRASSSSNQVMQDARQRAMQALMQSGSLAGQMGQQQFGQQSDIARARDIINQFNTQNSQSVQSRNVGMSNQAQLQNLMNQQNMMNMNTQLSNQQQQHNKALLQQQFNNQMARAGGMAGQYQGIAQAHQGDAGRIADMWAGIGSGVGKGMGAYGQYRQNKQEKQYAPFGPLDDEE